MLVKHSLVSAGIFCLLFLGAYFLNKTAKREFYEEMFTRSYHYEQTAKVVLQTESVFHPREYVRIGAVMNSVSDTKQQGDK
ncbi:MAG TPA: hypothetical protein VNM45_02415 [Bacillus sp. (in: firmicutes)]|nr:hypothetical protein [Bacillus sp. (in: firmicutes)]